MPISIHAIIFYILLIDSVGAVLTALMGGAWYSKHFRLMSRYFPVTAGWALGYLSLVLWNGYILSTFGELPWPKF
jgi:hypothetical protein